MSYNCPKCETSFEKDAKFCQTCGCNLELEYIENPICPKCKNTYPTNTKFCVLDGSRLVRQQDLIPRCTICNTAYNEDIKYCPKDGGEVKIIVTNQFAQLTYTQKLAYKEFEKKSVYTKAPFKDRFLAALLDTLITFGLSIPTIIFCILGKSKLDGYYHRDEAPALFLIASLLYIIPLVYTFIKDGLGEGQSWGKKYLNLMVVNLDNKTPCDKAKSFFRNFISGLVVMIPFIGWLIDPIIVLVSEDGRRLGDKAANTQVIELKKFKPQLYELF